MQAQKFYSLLYWNFGIVQLEVWNSRIIRLLVESHAAGFICRESKSIFVCSNCKCMYYWLQVNQHVVHVVA